MRRSNSIVSLVAAFADRPELVGTVIIAYMTGAEKVAGRKLTDVERYIVSSIRTESDAAAARRAKVAERKRASRARKAVAR